MLRKWLYVFAAAAAFAGASATPSRAAMLLTGLDPAAAAPSAVEKAQLVVGVGGPGFADLLRATRIRGTIINIGRLA